VRSLPQDCAALFAALLAKAQEELNARES